MAIEVTRNRRERTDDELVRRLAAGDLNALVAIDRRYRRRLVAYARSLLGRSQHDGEDVVQDVLVTAHAEIAAGRVPVHLGPWLFRLARNRAIDERRRARWGEGSLDALDETTATAALADLDDPPAVLHRRESVRTMVQDLADLPVAQRSALLSRVVDGDSPSESAARLGLSVEAVQMLVVRGRRNLERVRAIRRATGDVETQLMALASPSAILGVIGLTKIMGAGGGKLVTAGAAALAAVAAVGGLAVVKSEHAGPGSPAPFKVQGANAFVGHHLARGQTLPAGTAVIGLAVKVPAGRRDAAHRSVTLQCPRGMRYATMLYSDEDPDTEGLVFMPAYPGTQPRADGKAVFTLEGKNLAAPGTVRVRAICRTPGRGGSLVANPRLPKPGEGRGVTCHVGKIVVYLHRHGRPLEGGDISLGEHVAITSERGSWVRVVQDNRFSGWIHAALLCAGWSKPTAAIAARNLQG